MAWQDGLINNTPNPGKYANVNGVANHNTNPALIEFVNNVAGANQLVIKTAGSVSEIVYTSITPSYAQGNGSVLFEDVELNNTFDGGDDYYTWAIPTSICSFGFVGANIDADGELSNVACITP